MMMESNEMAIAFADAIIERLWVQGLINEKERELLKEKNSAELFRSIKS